MKYIDPDELTEEYGHALLQKLDDIQLLAVIVVPFLS
ncbi:protein of unknown function [Enterobacter cancerogenus]|nr:protein of unknown function [Enterobacter cancerogenus]